MSYMFDQLEALGATNVTVELTRSGIYRIKFELNGQKFHAQSDIDRAEIYAIHFASFASFSAIAESLKGVAV